MPSFVPKFAWQIPPDERATAMEGSDLLENYMAGEMPLKEQAEVWCWLNDMRDSEACAERLSEEACLHLELETGHVWPLD